MASVLTLSDAREHLSITDPQYDVKLQATIDAAESALVARVGPLGPTPKTARVTGGSMYLILPDAPVVSLESVTPVGSTVLDVDTLHLNSESGYVSMNDSCSYFGSLRYDVEYVAGRADCPGDLYEAIKELVRHMWQAQRGSSRQSTQQSTEAANTIPGAERLFPFRVEQLLAPYVLRRIS